MPDLPILTAKQRQEMIQRATATRRANAARLRSDFMDDGLWTELAKAAGIKLPPYGVPCTPGRMAASLGRLEIPVEAYLHWCGWRTLKEWVRANPAWPLKAFVGEALEHRGLILRQYPGAKEGAA